MSDQRAFTILVTNTSPDYWVATCEELPNAVGAGNSRGAALHDIRDSIQLILDFRLARDSNGSKIKLTV